MRQEVDRPIFHNQTVFKRRVQILHFCLQPPYLYSSATSTRQCKQVNRIHQLRMYSMGKFKYSLQSQSFVLILLSLSISRCRSQQKQTQLYLWHPLFQAQMNAFNWQKRNIVLCALLDCDRLKYIVIENNSTYHIDRTVPTSKYHIDSANI